ncbi:hypothetical protein HRbin37_02234 [bacterium HR37]|jgi:uncharacterized membrane protein YkvA (DUF1232 family)|nr:hypothetical protein HRbin37_02234 [bacterium HR37]
MKDFFKFCKLLVLRKNVGFLRALYKDHRIPRISRWLLWLAMAYLVLPFDLIPDFIPVLGHIDDVVVVPLLIGLALVMVPKEVYLEYSRNLLNKG